MAITTSVKTIEVEKIKPNKPNRQPSATHVRDLVESFDATTFATAVVLLPAADGEEYVWAPVVGFHHIEAAQRSEPA